MDVLDVEARRFFRFNLAAFFIGRHSISKSVETDQNLKFRYLIRVLDSTSGEIDILPFMQKELVVEFLLPDFKGIEEPPCSNSLSCGGLYKKQREDQPCYQVEVQGIVGDESLNAAQIGITLNQRNPIKILSHHYMLSTLFYHHGQEYSSASLIQAVGCILQPQSIYAAILDIVWK